MRGLQDSVCECAARTPAFVLRYSRLTLAPQSFQPFLSIAPQTHMALHLPTTSIHNYVAAAMTQAEEGIAQALL